MPQVVGDTDSRRGERSKTRALKARDLRVTVDHPLGIDSIVSLSNDNVRLMRLLHDGAPMRNLRELMRSGLGTSSRLC